MTMLLPLDTPPSFLPQQLPNHHRRHRSLPLPSLSLSRQVHQRGLETSPDIPERSSLPSRKSSNEAGTADTIEIQQKGTCGSRRKEGRKKTRVFFLDVNPLCYVGSRPSLHAFHYWVSLFFSQVSLSDPVIAVLDGEGGTEHRRQLLPSYKAHRRRFLGHLSTSRNPLNDFFKRSRVIKDLLSKCNVPVVKVEGHEADDVVATLVGQALEKGCRAVIASPDKDFKQLISEDVQIVLPIAELKRWSFYTLKHYISQYNCDPCSDLSLRCILGDEVDGVPGLQNVVPGFGRKTALKLLKKHGSLEKLLNAASVRTVGKQYAQDALTKHGDRLRRNYEVLALRKDVDVSLQQEWLVERQSRHDPIVLSNFLHFLEESQMTANRNKMHSSHS